MDLAPGWQLQVDTSPEWLFFRLQAVSDDRAPEPPLAEAIQRKSAETGIRRVIFELGEGTMLQSFVAGQLVLLVKWAYLNGGAFRICSFSEDNYYVIRLMHLTDRFPNYSNREAAVMGWLP
ncbi:hypothetical protein Mal4_29710 [Maioricimonas rarisocia]|uniref:Uncharacterized protein n=1 Tax=Maioricimonas rarisocia TaxID=2528026 RepID=A0A517Z878_9PLAN|nr:STAS domain-containing protein [Maioricimonas rarisocia]QDU38641.1 hypothetical protein Mal4_29710 [Maioricimonas rarisocia]